ncbi:hypothetical protein GCM10028801_15800 [Nocardioides maradonensis]
MDGMDMGGMDMGGGLPQLTWGRFAGTWQLEPGWLAACLLLVAAYLYARRRAGAASTVRGWRVACFIGGAALLWVTVASAVGAYAMSLFWMHMVLHLTLIMVVPALLVLGHPVTVIVEALPPARQERLRAELRRFPLSWISQPATGMVVYAGTIVATHLTGFMDQMAQHAWLMTSEQVLYVVAGFLFFLPLMGEEPIGSNPSYLFRLILLFIAMVPDTLVGVVLLQTNHAPFPVMLGMRPDWALAAVDDVHVAGGLMWAAGDGLMMIVAVGIMISAVTSPSKRQNMTGSWMEGARRATLISHVEQSGADVDAGLVDADSDEALEAYNRMLARLRDHDARDR